MNSDRLQRLKVYADRITGTFDTYGLEVARYGIAIVFIWFGALKPLGISPAADLVASTAFFFDPSWFVPVLGIWEVIIGICFLYRPLTRIGMALLIPQMAGTFLPLIVLPEVSFTAFPYGLTLEGQYIIKNIILIGAAMAIAGKTRNE